jgi:DNA-binding GntR family transcriptional regulator
MSRRITNSVEAERPDAGGAEGPLYRKLVGALRGEIQSGVYPVGGLLPTEAELRERFGVSRHTVREALRQLRDEGLVTSRQGAGTTVINPDASKRFVHEVDSIADLIAYAEEMRIQVDSSVMVTAYAELASKLECPVGQRWLKAVGYRYPAGQTSPAAWTEIYIHADYAGVALYLGRREGPIYLWIEEMYDTSVQEVEQVFTGAVVPDEVAGPLKLEKGATVIEARRNYFLAGGALAVIALTLYPAERFRHAMVLRRSRPAG